MEILIAIIAGQVSGSIITAIAFMAAFRFGINPIARDRVAKAHRESVGRKEDSQVGQIVADA